VLERGRLNAETVDPDVAERIAEVCVPLGMQPRAINVHYASSEGGMISYTEPCEALRVDLVDLEELASSSRALHLRSAVLSRGCLVWCCLPRGLAACRIPDRRAAGTPRGRGVGAGEGVTDGYVNTSSEGSSWGWLRVGDLGYMAEGELFVTGRSMRSSSALVRSTTRRTSSSGAARDRHRTWQLRRLFAT